MRRRLRHRRGYTAIEVMMSMVLLAIGAAGVISMQKVSVQGNADARRADVATGIANEWLARLRRDSMTWTEPNAVVTTSNIATTLWLKDTVSLAPPVAPDTNWLLPGTPPAGNGGIIGGGNAFDVVGRDVAVGDTATFFCVNYRLDWLSINSVIRAEVRVFWPRLENPVPANCNPATGEGGGQPLYHFVYATTTIRRNTL